MKKEKKERVLVAMSGGVDSSVAAILLHEQGFEVIGITMKTWDYAGSPKTTKSNKVTGCCDLDSMNDARRVAVKLGFPHNILDIRKEFGNYVISNFKSEYLSGRTPNPCILCNTHIKWEALLKRADLLDCKYIATGHYAQIEIKNNRYTISKGIDEDKDQSYALWGLSQESLKRTILPLGKFTKPNIKKIAKERGFEEIAKKSESYEICFIPDNDYRGFLKHSDPGLEKKVANGDFVLEDGTVVGKHQGYPFYTIGQRKGLGIALGYPVYVTEIKPQSNTVVLGTNKELLRNGMNVHKLNMILFPSIEGNKMETITKVRYNDKGTPAIIEQKKDNITVLFHKNVPAIAPGQAAVFYHEDVVIGGGWIKDSFNLNKM